MTTISRLDRAVIAVAGPDAPRLLHDTLTADLDRLPDRVGRWTALLSPQGKVLVEGLVTLSDGTYWFDLPPAAAEPFLKRMRLYKLRADVTFTDCADTHVVGWSTEPIESPLGYADERGLGHRVIAETGAAGGWRAEDGGYDERRIAAGIAEMGQDFATDSQFPHDLGMDLLSGIDFAKGCYVGQEVVSRMKHRGTARRRPVTVHAVGQLETGAELTSNGKAIGAVSSVAGQTGLAIVRIDRVSDPENVHAGEQHVRVAVPDWASYSFSESADAD